MVCDNCGNREARRMRFCLNGAFGCDHCLGLGATRMPDVFFKGAYLDPNLIDVNKPEQKDGVWIESRRQKAEIMERLGVREAGDRKHGSRPYDKFAIRRELEKRGQ